MYHRQITKPVTCIYTDTRHPTVLCHRHNTIISIFFIRFNRHNVLLTFNDEDILHGLYGYQIIKINNIYNIYNTLRQVTVSARRSHGDNWTIVHIGKERLLPTNDRPPLRHVTEATRRTLGKAHNPDNGWAVPIRYPTGTRLTGLGQSSDRNPSFSMAVMVVTTPNLLALHHMTSTYVNGQGENISPGDVRNAGCCPPLKTDSCLVRSPRKIWSLCHIAWRYLWLSPKILVPEALSLQIIRHGRPQKTCPFAGNWPNLVAL